MSETKFDLKRLDEIKWIHSRLSSLETEREQLRLMLPLQERIKLVDTEMESLREKLKGVMNDVCPVLKETSKLR